jgi:hypothetical protein
VDLASRVSGQLDGGPEQERRGGKPGEENMSLFFQHLSAFHQSGSEGRIVSN